MSSTEAVSEALRASLPQLPSVLPPVVVAGSQSGRELSDEKSGAERSGGYTRHSEEQDSEDPGAEERKRESDNESKTPPIAPGIPRGAAGDDGGNPERALPMLWPPPKSCTVLRDDVCRIPAHVVVRCVPQSGSDLFVRLSPLAPASLCAAAVYTPLAFELLST